MARTTRSRWLLAGVALLVVAAAAVHRPTPSAPADPGAAAPAVDPLTLLSRENPLAGAGVLAKRRLAPDGTLPLVNYVTARRQARAQLRQARLALRLGQIAPGAFARNWTELGPKDEGGRTRALVIDPRDPNVMFVGGVAGGVFKSTDAGATWKPITDTFGNVAVSSIALAPTNPDIVFVGTGEMIGSGYQNKTLGIGILKSNTSGRTWRLLPSTSGFAHVNDIVVSPNDPNIVYAATPEGVLRSPDGGGSWAPALQGPTDGCTDLAIRTDRNPDTLFAACALFAAGGVHRSVDGGATWEPVISDVAGQPAGSTVIAIAPSNQDIVYASVAEVVGSNDAALGLLRSDQGGANGTWELRNRADGTVGSPAFLSSCGAGYGQGYYDNALAVDPTDPNRLWVGGIDAFRSDDGGTTFTIGGYWELRQGFAMGNGSPYLHADQHTIVYHPNYNGADNQTVYFGNDGGVYRTTNDRAPLGNPDCEGTGDLNLLNDVVFDSISNGFSGIQFWGGGVSDDGRYVLGGTQDNGTYGIDRGSEAFGPNDWIQVQGGDGFEVDVSANNDAFYMEYYNGALTKRATMVVPPYGETYIGNRINDKGPWSTPFMLDPNNSNTLWVGMNSIWRSTDAGGSFIEAGRFGAGAVSALDIAPSNSEVLYAGTESGKVFVTTNASGQPPNFTDASNGLPPGFVGGIAIHPTDPNTAYAVYATFGIGKVWKTTDGGASWTNMDGTLPDVPVNDVAVNPLNPEMVYLGTDSGVYESPNGGRSWLPANGALTSTIVIEVSFRKGSSELYSFTHGRGAYQVDVGTGA